MKRLVSLLLVVCLFIIPLSTLNVSASEIEIKKNIEENAVLSQTVQLDDGSYIEYYITEEQNPSVQLFASAYTKTASKTAVGYDKKGAVMWKLTVKGTFRVNPGVNATCTGHSYSKTVNGSWKVEKDKSYISGTQAFAEAYFYRKTLWVTVESYNAKIGIYCDKNGNTK